MATKESVLQMNINWTTVISSGVVAVVIGMFQLVAARYTNRILDRIDKLLEKNKKHE